MANVVELKYSIEELNDLVKHSETCVFLEKKSRVLYMSPAQFSNLKSTIRECLDSLLLKYDFLFKAIVLGYKKIKLLNRYGSFCYRSTKVSVQIEADFYLFNPTVGSKLQGVVCKRSGHHLGCLLHKAFNVSIPLNRNTYETGWDFEIGQEVNFEVVSLDLTTGPLPYIKGQLDKEEEEGDEDDARSSRVGVEGENSFVHECGGSDSGMASSPGRETEESDCMERDSSSGDLRQKSSIETRLYKKPSKNILKSSSGDVLCKDSARAALSEDESGVSRCTSFEGDDTSLIGETAAQELSSQIDTSPKKPKRRNIKKGVLLEDKKVGGLEDDLETGSAVESVKSLFATEERIRSPKIDRKRESILRNIIGDLSPKNLETDTVRSILETLETTESEVSTSEKSIGSPKGVIKRKSILKNKEDATSPKVEEMNDESGASVSKTNDGTSVTPKEIKRRQSKSKTPKKNLSSDVMIQRLLKSMEKSFEEKDEGPTIEEKVEDVTSLPSKILFGEDELKKSEIGKDVTENDDEGATKKVKRKSISKNKKDTLLLYKSLAEKMLGTKGDVETSDKEGLGHASVASPRKLDIKDTKQDTLLDNVKESSPKTVKRKSILKSKKDSPPESEDLMKKLLKKMEMSVVGKEVEESEEARPSHNIAVESKDEEQNPKNIGATNIGDISPKKAAGKRKSISRKKDAVYSDLDAMTRRHRDVMPKISADEKTKDEQKEVIPRLDKSPEKDKSRKSLDNSPKGSTKKSKKLTDKIQSPVEECKTSTTDESSVNRDESNTFLTLAKDEDGKELKNLDILDRADSLGEMQIKKKESLGERKAKKRKSVSTVTPDDKKMEVEDEIAKLLSMHKKLLGIDSMDNSRKEVETLSNEEKRSKKRKRESSGVKESSKKDSCS